ncbi:GntR family transcriptional regulator [Actinoallomurus rhizosphaericola]|uniref:GntR family transcriptional regulator n=1 Tax=Actinoallomurus rhizosphaericola TaxID=2952536 RepID=UPI0020938A0D|nr:GntR family transcriptional regulator [Actinoallomurus rhizosphaericola]MCO5995806.1 GntR family transcriptional regulator [Actinoallomurus rhizosphaericola]
MAARGHGPGGAHDAQVRRLRDLLRSAVLRGRFDGGQLPGEAELMASYGATRATVREALGLLRREGLIDRRQGVGTHVVVNAVLARMAEAHGAADPMADSIFNRRMRPRVLDRSEVPLPAVAAERLGAPPGAPCLRLEYVALVEDEPTALATNYVLFPEGERLLAPPFDSDWYALLREAGLRFGESEFIMGCSAADPATASLLAVAEGAPLITFEQVIRDPDGRPFNLAHIHTRGDRFLFVSRAVRATP